MTPGLVSYSATKGAVKMFTQGLSREVVGASPSTTFSRVKDSIDLAMEIAEEVAALVAFVAGAGWNHRISPVRT